VTRGIAERLRAVERFFDRYPSWRGRLVFCQVAVPSRTRVDEYREMKKEIDGLVARINARFGTDSWLPVRYLYKVLDADDLAAHFVAADVLLATPLSDGVGFVPLEYVAARTQGDGTLLLSSLAGTADLLPEATRVNPYDEDGVAAALHGAVEARPSEVEGRMRALRERVRAHDLRIGLGAFWHAAFGEELVEAAAPVPPAAHEEIYAPAPT
jgi:trehalose-6-phosphate synthase